MPKSRFPMCLIPRLLNEGQITPHRSPMFSPSPSQSFTTCSCDAQSIPTNHAFYGAAAGPRFRTAKTHS